MSHGTVKGLRADRVVRYSLLTLKHRIRQFIDYLAGHLKAIVLIAVERAAPLVSPGYLDGTTEAEMRERYRLIWQELYGWR